MQCVPHALVACRALLAAEHDCVANRAAHQVVSLGHVGKEAAPLRRQRFAGAVLQHDAALSRLARAEGHHRLERRRLAAAAGSRERHELAACDCHVGAADQASLTHSLAVATEGGIAARNATQLEPAELGDPRGDPSRLAPRLSRQCLGLHEALGTRRHGEVLGNAAGDVSQGALHLAHELKRRHERAVAHRALQDAVAAIHHGQQVCSAHCEAKPDVAHVGETVAPHARCAVLVEKPGRAGLDVALPLEALDHHEAVEALGEVGPGAAVGLADFLVQTLEHAAKAECERREHGARRHDHPCHLGNHHHEQREGPHELGEHARSRGHDRGGAGRDDACVVRQAAHPLPGMGCLHARQVGVQHLVEQPQLERVLERRLHALAQKALQRLHRDDGDGDGRKHDHACQKGVRHPTCGRVHQVAHDPGRIDAPGRKGDLEHREGGHHPQAAAQDADYPGGGMQVGVVIHSAKSPCTKTRGKAPQPTPARCPPARAAGRARPRPRWPSARSRRTRRPGRR